MEFKMKVHGAQVGSAPASVEYGGNQVRAQIDCLEVEFSSDDPMQGSFTRRFTGDELEAAREMFTPDKEVTVTISA